LEEGAKRELEKALQSMSATVRESSDLRRRLREVGSESNEMLVEAFFVVAKTIAPTLAALFLREKNIVGALAPDDDLLLDAIRSLQISFRAEAVGLTVSSPPNDPRAGSLVREWNASLQRAIKEGELPLEMAGVGLLMLEVLHLSIRTVDSRKDASIRFLLRQFPEAVLTSQERQGLIELP